MNRIAQAAQEIARQFPQKKAETPGEALLGFLVLMSVLALFFWFLESKCPENRESRRRPGSLRTDLTYWLLGAFVDKTVFGLILFSVVVLLVLLRVPRLDTVVGHQPLLLQFLEAAFLADLINYWTHRLMHTKAPLWRLHAVHHSSTHLDWIAGARSHPLEGVVTRLIGVVPLYLAGFSPAVYASIGPVLGLYGVLLHANVDWDFGRFRWILVSPRYHRWHHSQQAEAIDKNFAGLFPVIDRMFGTAYLPAAQRPARFGLEGDWMPEGVWAQFLSPFRKRMVAPPPLPPAL